MHQMHKQRGELASYRQSSISMKLGDTVLAYMWGQNYRCGEHVRNVQEADVCTNAENVQARIAWILLVEVKAKSNVVLIALSRHMVVDQLVS